VDLLLVLVSPLVHSIPASLDQCGQSWLESPSNNPARILKKNQRSGFKFFAVELVQSNLLLCNQGVGPGGLAPLHLLVAVHIDQTLLDSMLRLAQTRARIIWTLLRFG
jgi:hypothetical protein